MSLRAQPYPHAAPDPPQVDDQGGGGAGQSSSSAVQVHVSNRKKASERNADWMQDFGRSLFDVFSEVAMVKALEEGLSLRLSELRRNL